jgi:hypothetical protein
MKRWQLWLVLSLCVPFKVTADDNIMSSYHNGKRYDFSFSCQQLKKTPPWPAAANTPPLAPRRAVDQARHHLKSLVANADAWVINEIGLRSACTENHWFYLIEFSPPQMGLHSGLGLVVLMDGHTVTPTISPWPVER